MKPCKCGSWAINPGMNGRKHDLPDLCDVCYWKEKYKGVEPLKKCKCGSMTITPGMNGRENDSTGLCDVCYWKRKYELSIENRLFLLWDGCDGYEVGEVVDIIFEPAITVDGKLLIGSEEIFDACRCGGDCCCSEIGCLLDLAEIKMVVKLK